MKEGTSAGTIWSTRRMAFAAALALVLCLPQAWARGQRQSAPRPAAAPHYSAPHPAANRAYARSLQGNGQPKGNQGYPQYRGAGQQPAYRPPAAGYPNAVRPALPGPSYEGQGYARPAYSGAGQQAYGPPGHLGAWLNAHRGVSAEQQEQMLRNDPSFNRLPPATQQRLMQQLNRVDQMPEAQRQRTLARNENLERMSPEARAQVQESVRRFRTLPADRQAVMKSAFQDLRNVPLDQRQTVLNSARYQNAFSPDERGILSNMLSAEPYLPPR